jgi:hypothetical protein
MNFPPLDTFCLSVHLWRYGIDGLVDVFYFLGRVGTKRSSASRVRVGASWHQSAGQSSAEYSLALLTNIIPPGAGRMGCRAHGSHAQQDLGGDGGEHRLARSVRCNTKRVSRCAQCETGKRCERGWLRAAWSSAVSAL